MNLDPEALTELLSAGWSALTLALAFALSLFASVAVVHQFVEPHLIPPRWRDWLGKLLRNREIVRSATHGSHSPAGDPPRTVGAVLLSSTGLFDRIFGLRHWTLRCFFASALLTLSFAGLSLWLVGAYFSSASMHSIVDALLTQRNIAILFIAFAWNAAVDWVSLWETRWVIGLMRREGGTRQAAFLLLIDLLFTYFLFLVGTVLLKTALDLYFVLPLMYQHDSLTVATGVGPSVTLTAADGLPATLLGYLLHSFELALQSSLSVLKGFSHSYWTLSLYLDAEPSYILPTSTFWATTHLFSVFIYAYLIIWLMATRMVFLQRIVISDSRPHLLRRLLFRGNMSIEEYPVTILALNAGLWFGMIYTVYWVAVYF